MTDAVVAADQCRISLPAALSSILDIRTAYEVGEDDGSSEMCSLTSILQYITDWINSSYSAKDSSEVHTPPTKSTESIGFLDMFLTMLNISSPEAVSTHPNEFGKIDSLDYSAIFIHIFIDKPHQCQPDTMPSLIKHARELNCCINIWAICSYESNDCNLSSLFPITRSTSGSIHRFSLGVTPKDEILRLTETMTRIICNYKIALQCKLKVRMTPVQLSGCEISPSSATGSGVVGFGHSDVTESSPEGVHNIVACDEDSTYGFRIVYTSTHKGSMVVGDMGNERADVGIGLGGKLSAIVIQLCFMYDTFEPVVDEPVGYRDTENKVLSMAVMEREETIAQQKQMIADALSIYGISRTTINDKMSEILDSLNPPIAFNIRNNRSSRPSYVRSAVRLDVNRELQVKRYLRVYTVAVECTDKLVTLRGPACRVSICMALALREAAKVDTTFNDKSHDGSSSDTAPITEKLVTGKIYNSRVGIVFDTMLALVDSNKISNISEVTVDNIFSNGSTENSKISDCINLLRSFMVRELQNGDHDSNVVERDMILHFNASIVSKIMIPTLYAVDISTDNFSLVKVDTKGNFGFLTRESLVRSCSNVYLLDTGKELIYYKAIPPMGTTLYGGMVTSIGQSISSNNSDNGKQTNDKEIAEEIELGEELVSFMCRRLIESPVVPRLLVAEAGTASATYFTDYLVDENPVLTFNELKLVVHRLLTTS